MSTWTEVETSTEPTTAFPANPARELRRSFAGVKVSFTWMGTSKAVSKGQRDEMARAVGADGKATSSSKKILDSKHPAWKAMTALKGRIEAYRDQNSLDYPEPGIRLMRQDKVEDFQVCMEAYRNDLSYAVAHLETAFYDIREAARAELGTLFNPADYPASLDGLFTVEWSFPSIEPPDYLLELKPALYEQERARVTARFEEAVRLAEEEFTGAFAEVIAHLTERLTPDDQGQTKVFKSASLDNVRSFFDRFKALNIHSSPQLDQLVAEAQRITSGLTPRELKTHSGLRDAVRANLATVQTSLDALLIDRPRRNIIRPVLATVARSESEPTPSPEELS